MKRREAAAAFIVAVWNTAGPEICRQKEPGPLFGWSSSERQTTRIEGARSTPADLETEIRSFDTARIGEK